MSDDEADATETSREEDRLAYEIYFLIVKTVCEKGFVKLSEMRKLYQKTVLNDKTVQFRPLGFLLKDVNENLLHWQGWKAVEKDDRLAYINVTAKMPVGESLPSETERTLGVLKNALMYVFMATKPHAKHPGVPHEELMAYMETSMSTDKDHKISHEHMELLKKQIAPNNRADFVKKGYLAWSKSVNENDEEVFRYEWGPVARLTVDPVELVQVFQKLTGMAAGQVKEQTERARAWKTEQLDNAEQVRSKQK